MTDRLRVTRNQLAAFIPDFETIKQFERLIALVDAASGSGSFDVDVLESATANARATQALSELSRIADALELLVTQPAIQHNNSIATDYIDLPEIGPHATKERRVQWNLDDGTLDVGLYGGAVLQVGQESLYYAKNTSGAPIAIGTPVMFTGTVGSSGKLTFGLAVADGSVLSDYMMGVTTQTIADNGFGYVCHFGLVRGFDTTGTPYGEVWNDGDLLYFDPATAGTWTNVQPVAPNINVPVAVVVTAGPGGSGSIFVRMTIDETLSRLQDVYINGSGTPNDFDILLYDAANSRWQNKPASAVQVLEWMSI